jgi:hypothetical protein
MRKTTFISLGVLAVFGLLAGTTSASQTELVHVSNIYLGDYFNSTTGYGDNPLSIAFDGTNAFIGGFNNSGAAANVGVVKVSGIFGGTPSFTSLGTTQFSAQSQRGLDSLAYDAASDSLIMHYDAGASVPGFVSRRNASDGSNVWSINNPQGVRPLGAVGVDPVGDNGNPGVAYLVQGSGRRRLLSMTDGSTIYDSTNGGIINSTPTVFGSAWRGVGFDSDGNIALSEDTGFQYGVRVGVNQWQALNGTLNATSSSVQKNVVANSVGQGIVILEDLGSDLLAFSGRNMTTLTDLDGGVTNVSDTNVHIRNVDGSITGLTQIVLTGDENGIGTAWQNDTKNLAFGLDDDGGLATLLVVDFIERRLDVYQVPEPASLGLLAAGSLIVLLRRRRK